MTKWAQPSLKLYLPFFTVQVNPPYHVPLVEIVPSPWTDDAVVQRTKALLEEIGQVPVTLKNELPGFVLNRIQYSIINECYKLVAVSFWIFP